MRQRSCRCTTPSTCWPRSTTTTAVMRRCSRMCSAAAAMVSGGTVIGLVVMISPAGRSSKCVARGGAAADDRRVLAGVHQLLDAHQPLADLAAGMQVGEVFLTEPLGHE